MLAPLPPLAAGVFGWFQPTCAWVGLGLAFGPIVTVAMDYDGVISIVPKEPRPRWTAWAIGYIGYGVLCGVAALGGAWLAR
jgi:hypothetical protein